MNSKSGTCRREGKRKVALGLFLLLTTYYLLPSVVFAGGSVHSTTSSGGGLSGSLTSSWNFNSSTVTGTSVADQSGNGHTLTLVNGASITTGRSGEAITLNGSNQYAYGLIGSLPTSVSLSMWVKANDVATEQSILVEEGSGAPSSGYHFTLVGIKNSKFYAGFWDIGDIAGLNTLVTGQWYHVILSYDGVAHTQSLYVDNVLQGTQNGTWSPPDPIYFLVGYQQQNCSFTSASGFCGDLANYFNGQVDDLQAYNQAMTQSDVNSLASSVAKVGRTFQSGLSGKYYDGTNFDTYMGTYVDSTIDFNPADTTLGVNRAGGGDTFSVRWTGSVYAPYTGTYTFYTNSDDGVRLYVNGSTLVNNWTDHGPTENSNTISLTAGHWYPIQLDFYENGGGAVIQLSWSHASIAKQIVPTADLKPAANSATFNSSSVGALSNGSTLNSGLVMAYTFDGTTASSTSVQDMSRNGVTGTVSGGLTRIAGKLGQALSFDGSATHMQASDTSFPSGAGARTVSMWMRPSAQPGLNVGEVALSYGTATTGNAFGLGYIDSAGTKIVRLFGWGADLDYTYTLPTTKWTHVVGVFDGTTASIYVNGAFATSHAESWNTVLNHFDLGRDPNGAQYYGGGLDDVRLYSRALSVSEVKQLYLIGK